MHWKDKDDISSLTQELHAKVAGLVDEFEMLEMQLRADKASVRTRVRTREQRELWRGRDARTLEAQVEAKRVKAVRKHLMRLSGRIDRLRSDMLRGVSASTTSEESSEMGAVVAGEEEVVVASPMATSTSSFSTPEAAVRSESEESTESEVSAPQVPARKVKAKKKMKKASVVTQALPEGKQKKKKNKKKVKKKQKAEKQDSAAEKRQRVDSKRDKLKMQADADRLFRSFSSTCG